MVYSHGFQNDLEVFRNGKCSPLLSHLASEIDLLKARTTKKLSTFARNVKVFTMTNIIGMEISKTVGPIQIKIARL